MVALSWGFQISLLNRNQGELCGWKCKNPSPLNYQVQIFSYGRCNASQGCIWNLEFHKLFFSILRYLLSKQWLSWRRGSVEMGNRVGDKAHSGYMHVLVQRFWTWNWFAKTLVRKESLLQVASCGGKMGGEWEGAVVEWFLKQTYTESQVNLNLQCRGSCGGSVFPCSVQPVSALASCAREVWLRSQKQCHVLLLGRCSAPEPLWGCVPGVRREHCDPLWGGTSQDTNVICRQASLLPARITLLSWALHSAVVSSITVPFSTLHLNYQLILI